MLVPIRYASGPIRAQCGKFRRLHEVKILLTLTFSSHLL